MIKDRSQKQLALKLCVAQGIVPFVEVLVRSHTDLEDAPTDITDIDVLGLDLGKAGALTRTIFDCKSGSKMSPVNRAIWAAGLRIFVGADRAVVILKKDAPYSHRLAANDLKVTIQSEVAFAKYARSVSPNFDRDVSYLDNMNTWDAIITLGQNNPALTDLLWYVATQSALEQRGAKGIRNCLSALKRCGPELDPRKPLHKVLFGCTVSSFLIALSLSVTSLIQIFQFSMDKKDFEKTVRYFVWEGRENYEMRASMKHAIDRAKGEVANTPFELPEWGRFIELIRLLLDASEALAELPFLCKEFAFRANQQSRQSPDQHLRDIFQSNNRARQFIFATASYLVCAAGLPREFVSGLENEINGLVTPQLV